MVHTQDDFIVSDSELVVASDAQISTIPQQQLVVNDEVELGITTRYHLSEIKQNEAIIDTAKKIIWSGFSVIAVGILLAYFGRTTTAIITAVTGVITELISAIIFAFVTMSNKNKLKYFEQLSISEECEKYMDVISQLEDRKAKEKLLDKMVSNYCERRKPS